MAMKSAAVWFRCDLRLDDNPVLSAATNDTTTLLPMYIFNPSVFQKPTLAGTKKSSARRARFLLESVACLRRRLEAAGSGLAVAVGKPEDVIPLLCGQKSGVFVQQGVCSEEQGEERRLEARLRGQLRRVWGGTLYMPEECGCSPDSTPTVFTDFKNRAEGRGRIRNPLDAPRLPGLPERSEELSKALKCLPTLQDLGYSESEASSAMQDDPRAVMTFEGGEEAALQRLQRWMFDQDKLQDYFDIRNGMLGADYSSKLSPWLALGCISPRRVWKEVKRYEAERVKNKSTYWLVFELTWRDFFIYLARSQGSRIFKQGGVIGDRTPWRRNPDAFARWKEGRTNDPLVDANMRELAATGFMSNRGRQNVASYLIFDLGVDWRFGAAHFEEHLLDYDPCSNWGNWVAAAGLTGQRINKFNTKKQLSQYDPEGKYVRHWQHRVAKADMRNWLQSRPAAAAPAAPAAAAKGNKDEEAKRRARAERFGLKSDASGGGAKRAHDASSDLDSKRGR